MAQIFLNNCYATLAQAITASDTQLELSGMNGFPAFLGAGDYFLLTLYADTTRYGENIEVVKVTGLSGTTLTVERGYEEGAYAHAMGARIEARLTAETLATFATQEQANNTSFPRYDLSSISTTATLDLATGNEFTVDASTARTLTFANVPTGRSMTVVLSITGASAITWPAGIRWHGDGTTAPELGATWTIVVLNYDGANWSGVLGASA
ncbi:hypothetical protein [Halomonas sp. 707B3]|uniref:hypothetical protein n=1 Tax=Halomonas sp. 707B3 TaxID=1681043 RepID=UPI00209FDE27|nr:hypothetical protein [Halomonas sp. 707B3]MCP1319722.1 hypothetical protein [Halomonas sp. 707B3]